MKKAIITLLIVLMAAFFSNLAHAECGCKKEKDSNPPQKETDNPSQKDNNPPLKKEGNPSLVP